MPDAIIYIGNDGQVKCHDANGADCTYLASNQFNATPLADAVGNTIQFGFVANANIEDIVGAPKMSAVFRLYQIEKIEWRISYEAGDSATNYPGGAATQSPGVPHVYWIWNPHDQLAPNSYEDVLTVTNCKDQVCSNDRPIKIVHSAYPITRTVDNDGTSSTANSIITRNQWLRTENQSPHCSTKWWVRNFGGVASGARLRVQPVALLKFKMMY
jgi:hypothetical protein